MSGIRGKDTLPELIVRRFLHKHGFRYRLHAKLPGKPDIVLPKYRVVIFVHGCFWHRHQNCRFSTTPKSNAEFWQRKFAENVERDAKTKRALEELTWHTLIAWACQLTEQDLRELADRIRENLPQDNNSRVRTTPNIRKSP